MSLRMLLLLLAVAAYLGSNYGNMVVVLSSRWTSHE